MADVGDDVELLADGFLLKIFHQMDLSRSRSDTIAITYNCSIFNASSIFNFKMCLLIESKYLRQNVRVPALQRNHFKSCEGDTMSCLRLCGETQENAPRNISQTYSRGQETMLSGRICPLQSLKQ